VTILHLKDPKSIFFCFRTVSLGGSGLTEWLCRSFLVTFFSTPFPEIKGREYTARRLKLFFFLRKVGVVNFSSEKKSKI